MQLKLFCGPVANLAGLEAEVNQWLAANPKFLTFQRDSAVYHDHATGGEGVLLTLWHEPKSGL